MMRSIFFVIFLLCVICQVNTQETLFNDGWQFHKGDIPNGEKNLNDTTTLAQCNAAARLEY